MLEPQPKIGQFVRRGVKEHLSKMRVLNHLLPIICCLNSVPNVFGLDLCENGVVTDSLIMMNYSEDDCLQSNPKHCYKSIDSEGGLCYLGKEEKTIHLSEDCVYRLPIIYESENIVLSEEYVARALSGPMTLNESFPDNAFKHCESTNCYLVVHEQTTNTTFFMANPSELSLKESGITFGSSGKRYKFYFEPRCEPQEEIQVRQNVQDLCSEFDGPPNNAVFIVGWDATIKMTVPNENYCLNECIEASDCTSFEFYPENRDCKIWKDLPTIPSGRICSIESNFGPVYSRELTTSEYTIKPDAILAYSTIDGCWDRCVSNPECQAITIDQPYCLMLRYGGEDARNVGSRSEGDLLIVSGKIFSETACDYGVGSETGVYGTEYPELCKTYGLCHQNLGTPNNPGHLCYAATERTPEPISFDDGTFTIVDVDYPDAKLKLEEIPNLFPEPKAGWTYKTCLLSCLEVSCFAVMFDEQSLDDPCRLAIEPFTFDYNVLGTHPVHISFFRQESFVPLPVEELCKDQDGLPSYLEYSSLYYHEYSEVTGDSIDTCIEKCNPDGICDKRIIFRSNDQTCLIFEHPFEVFIQDSGTDPLTPPDLHGGQQCTVNLTLPGQLRPKIFYDGLNVDTVPVQARETHHLPIDTAQARYLRNQCWEHCNQIPWCQAVLIDRPPGGAICLFYDREDSLFKTEDIGGQSLPHFAMIGKKLTDEDICDNGGTLDQKLFNFFIPQGAESCHFLQLCSRDTEVGSTFCYVATETKPDPLTVNGCVMQPFITSSENIVISRLFINRFFSTQFPNTISYEACVQKCSWDKHCLALAYIPSTLECALSILGTYKTTKRTNFLDEIKRNPQDEVEAIMAVDIPHCQPCVRRVLMQEQISFKDEIQCTITSQESCSDVYKTIFKTQEVEECKESFVKNCHIEYEMVPTSEKVEVCHSPLARDCNEEGPETCTTEYETVCATTYHENEVTDDVANCTTVKEDVCDPSGENCRMVPKQVCQVDTVSSKKLTPETDCRQEAREVCGPEICPIVKGDRICADELKTNVQEVPQEKCQITPKTVCDLVHKIVPKLEMSQECIDVPQEVCQRVQVEAEKEKIPIVKEWCPPNEEDSDMSGEDGSSSEDL